MKLSNYIPRTKYELIGMYDMMYMYIIAHWRAVKKWWRS